MSEVELTCRVEYAKSSRGLCQKCKKHIQQGELRVGRQYNPDHSGHLFFHPRCFIHYPSKGTSAEDFFFGWEDISAKDKKLIEGYCGGGSSAASTTKDAAQAKEAKEAKDYSGMTVAALKAEIAARGITPVPKLKADLIQALEDDDDDEGADDDSDDDEDVPKPAAKDSDDDDSDDDDDGAANKAVKIGDCVFCVSGTMSITQKALKTKAESHGAELKSSVTEAVTHLITTADEVAKRTAKVVKAQELGVPLVTEAFLNDLVAGKACKPSDYRVGSSQKRATPDEASSSSEEEKPPAKKQTAKGGKAKAAPAKKKKPETPPSSESDESESESDDDDSDDDEEDEEDSPAVAQGEQLPLDSNHMFAIGGAAPSAKNWTFQAKGEPAFNNTNYQILVHRVFQVTDIKDNHNKYYSMEIHQGSSGSFRLFTHYGRTDDLTSNPESGRRETKYFSNLDDVKRFWNKLIRDKTSPKKGYQAVSLASSNIGSPLARGRSAGRVGEATRARAAASSSSSSSSGAASSSSSSEPAVQKASSLPPEVQNVVSAIFEETSTALTSQIDARITAKGIETPLGVLTIEQINLGENVLQKIHEELTRSSPRSAVLESLTSEYFTKIPHRIGRTKVAIRDAVVNNLDKYKAETDLIQLMRDMLQVDSVGQSDTAHENVFHSTDVDLKYASLNATIEPLDKTSEEYTNLLRYFKKTETGGIGKWAHQGRKPEDVPQPTGKLSANIRNIFTVNNSGPRADYDGSVGNEHLLYHGSRLRNFVGLLSRGLLMPDLVTAMGIPRTDYGWLGAGVYFGDCFNTAAQYASPGKNKETRLILVCRVALGKWGEQLKRDGSIRQPHPGCDSLHGNPHLPSTQFQDDEFAVYKQNRQYTAYLVEFTDGVGYF